MTGALKRCPFCGGKAIVEYDKGINKYWVACNNSKCRVQPTTDAHERRFVVTREWNRRANNGA